MLLINTEHTPHKLIHSPLVGVDCKVSLYYSSSLEVMINRHINPIDEFLNKTTVVRDVERMLMSSLSKTESLMGGFTSHKNGNVKAMIKAAILDDQSNINLRELRHATKISTLDLEIRIETTIEELINIDENTVNMFYTVVHTKVADLQSDPIA